MRTSRTILIALALAACDSPAAEHEEAGASHFTLWPKAFTPNPDLEMTLFTAVTHHGRSLPEASPDHPVYFTAQDEGFHAMGYPLAGEHSPMPAELERVLHEALKVRGYLPAEGTTHAPGLVLIFYWGSHNSIDQDLAGQIPDLRRQHTLERANLIGGKAYGHRVELQLDFGTTPLDRSLKQDFLFYQSDRSLYYAVVSAYSYDEVARNERHLAWRTTMTVNADGVSMQETLPPLILTAGDYFGRATDEVVAIRRTVRRGTVKLGPLRIVESDVPLAPRAHKY